MNKKTCCEKMKELFDGECTLTKREVWLIGVCCLLFGVVYGLLKAPLTHGVKIGCGNGNNNTGSDWHKLEEDDCKKHERKCKHVEKKQKCCKKHHEDECIEESYLK